MTCLPLKRKQVYSQALPSCTAQFLLSCDHIFARLSAFLLYSQSTNRRPSCQPHSLESLNFSFALIQLNHFITSEGWILAVVACVFPMRDPVVKTLRCNDRYIPLINSDEQYQKKRWPNDLRFARWKRNLKGSQSSKVTTNLKHYPQ